MTISILAAVFLLLILGIALLGFKAIIKQGRSPEDLNKERCSICRAQYPRGQLIERQVGDYRLLYFCPSCIGSLYSDLTSKN
ncbi:MAG: hypothetical protein AB1428_04375 [Bacteroidota bacterium]